jgi:hypothetical protein
MSNPKELEVLERIFSDAHVKDVDFSVWDQSLAICVLADHFREITGGRCPLILVRFREVKEFRVVFNHLEQEPLRSGVSRRVG